MNFFPSILYNEIIIDTFLPTGKDFLVRGNNANLSMRVLKRESQTWQVFWLDL